MTEEDHLALRTAALGRVVDKLDRVSAFAKHQAISARATLLPDEERRWLDLLAILERP